LDANANRAREGLRTTEDYVRFLLGDLHYAQQLRSVRHGLTEILCTMGLSEELVLSRNVGTDPLQPENWKDVLRRVDKETPLDIAHRGIKRSQEALRVLEENTRGNYPQQAEELSKLRFRLYELEQWLVCVSPAMEIVNAAKVYVLITATLCKKCSVFETAKAVLLGGVKFLQLREKEKNDTEFLADLRRLQDLCAEQRAVLCCNDRLDLALLAECKAVHLGQEDVGPEEARRLAGRRVVIGRSTHTVQQARTAVDKEHADYIAIGSMFETRTKDRAIVAGLKLAEDIAALSIKVPIFAIGGVTLGKLGALKAAGVKRVAVSQAIIGSDAPQEEAQKFVEEMAK
jgi:thiamine-phosphate pyrophosphorylase